MVKHLAQGGMADVLIARTGGIEGFERHVVVKRIRAEQARDTHYVNMFLDEARLAAALHHQNVVQVHDIGQEHGEYFFAMEYVHGQDVRKLLMELADKGLRPPLEHIITIITGAAAGLHHAHEQRGPDRKPLDIVHRDVSPANILIGYDGSVKVADFGIAKAAHRTAETQSGNMKGKVAYMSPEQCTGLPLDRRSDVFSLGIVLYELCTVRRLFNADNDFLTMTAIVRGDYPKPSQFWPALSPELEKIIMKALSVSPADRYATTEEMRLALEQFASSLGLRTSTTALGDYLKQQFPNQTLPWLADDDEPEMYLSIDFADSVVGVEVPPQVLEQLLAAPAPVEVMPNSPMHRARSRAITGRQLYPKRAITSSGAATDALAAPAAAASRATTISARSRKRLAATLAIVAAVVGLVVALGVVRPGAEAPRKGVAPAMAPIERPATSAPPTLLVVDPPRAPAPPAAPTPTVEPTPEPDTVAAPEPSASPPKDARKHARSKRKPVSKPQAKRWDPNALFPK
ncbi:MAG: serine/threonine-protein kinase [Kofleriaceae bacterium]